MQGCDLVDLRTGDLVIDPEIRTRATVTQRETRRPVQFEIAADVRAKLVEQLGAIPRQGNFADFSTATRLPVCDDSNDVVEIFKLWN